MHRYHLVKAEADDHMPDKAASGLVPLKSWFSLDLAAHQDKDDAEEEVEADLHSGAPSRAMLPSRLPRLWSSHRGVGKSRSTDDDVQSEQVPSTAPAESDSKQARCGALHSASSLAEAWSPTVELLTQGKERFLIAGARKSLAVVPQLQWALSRGAGISQ